MFTTFNLHWITGMDCRYLFRYEEKRWICPGFGWKSSSFCVSRILIETTSRGHPRVNKIPPFPIPSASCSLSHRSGPALTSWAAAPLSQSVGRRDGARSRYSIFFDIGMAAKFPVITAVWHRKRQRVCACMFLVILRRMEMLLLLLLPASPCVDCSNSSGWVSDWFVQKKL